VLLFDVARGSVEKTIRSSHVGAVRSVVFASASAGESHGDGGVVMYIGGNDRRVVEWSVSDAVELRSWLAEDGPVAALAVAHAGDVLATASNTVTLWQRSTLAKLAQYTGHASLTRLLVFSPADHYVISAARDRYVSLWPTAKAPANASARLGVNDALPVTLIAPDASAPADNFRFGVVDVNGAAVLWNFVAAVDAAASQQQAAQRSQTMTACSRVTSSPAAPVLHARLRVDSDTETILALARGVAARPKLQTVSLRGDAPQHVLLAAVPLEAPSDAAAAAAATAVSAAGKSSGVRQAGASVLGAESIPLRSGTVADDDIEVLQQLARDEERLEAGGAAGANEMSLAERVARAGVPNDDRKRDKASKDSLTLQADSLQTMLTQSLQSDDRALLDEVLAVSDATIINNTLRGLPARSVLPLLAAIVRLFHGKPKRAMALALWLRSLLACHAAYLASLPDLTSTLGTLYQAIDTRLRSFDALLRLDGRVDMLLLQSQAKRQNEAVAAAPAVQYEESDSEEGDASDNEMSRALVDVGDDDDDDDDDDDEDDDEASSDADADSLNLENVAALDDLDDDDLDDLLDQAEADGDDDDDDDDSE
jgi:U3 small nucleolar RNA-associated protein 5